MDVRAELGEPSGGSVLVWCAAELLKLAGEDDCCTAVPAGCSCYGDVRRLQASAAEVLVPLDVRGGLRSCGPTSAKFCREVRRGPRLVPGGADREQRRGGDSPERRTGVGRSWPSLEKKELAAKLEIRYKAGNIEIKGQEARHAC